MLYGTAEPIMDTNRTFEVFRPNNGVPIKSWTVGVAFEPQAKSQLEKLASLPFIHPWIAVMPDVHQGKGATVGSVIPTQKAVIPAAVGVDIGCGMMAQRTSLLARDLPSDLRVLRRAIEAAVPHGRTHNGGPGDKGAFADLPQTHREAWAKLDPGYRAIAAKHPKIDRGPHATHLGTLGTGNHFIEICLDEDEHVWFVLHSGSRGVGNRIGSYFIALARKHMQQWFIHLPDPDLAYLPEGTSHFDDYMEAAGWAQEYARANRELMMQSVVNAVRSTLASSFDDSLVSVNCHHNYVDRESHQGKSLLITRKGAVRARLGDWGIIPGSMGARSFIVRGLGNPESFHSCSHGAGRLMSRSEAKRRFNVNDHVQATTGIECRKDEEVIDETPAAYKPIDQVMHAQRDLVEVVHTLRQVVCVKG